MKLVDILVEELPKRGGWPEGAEYCHLIESDRHCLTIAFSHTQAGTGSNQIISMKEMVFSGIGSLGYRLHDCTVTAEQYEAALAVENDGWIEWGGGEYPPVSTNAVVDVKLRCGSVTVRQPAGAMNWQSNAPDEPGDIIAYRLHRPQKAEQVRADAWNAYAGITMADEEADLNECIGQNAAPVWSGEGLPPVGCECEYSLNGGKTWCNCKIDYIVGTQGVVMLCDTFEGVQYVQFSSYGNALKFRPIRSEADRKRDDICDKIYGAMTNAKRKDNRSDMAEEIYDAIAAGKIPGLRLED